MQDADRRFCSRTDGYAISVGVVCDEIQKGPDLGGKMFPARIDREQRRVPRRSLRENQLQMSVGQILANEPLIAPRRAPPIRARGRTPVFRRVMGAGSASAPDSTKSH